MNTKKAAQVYPRAASKHVLYVYADLTGVAAGFFFLNRSKGLGGGVGDGGPAFCIESAVFWRFARLALSSLATFLKGLVILFNISFGEGGGGGLAGGGVCALAIVVASVIAKPIGMVNKYLRAAELLFLVIFINLILIVLDAINYVNYRKKV